MEASLIDGKTTHVIGSVSLKRDGTMSDKVKAKLQAFWKRKQYLIIDEYSMLSKTFLSTLERNIGIGKQGSESQRAGYSFGGVNVVLCGDLHQSPPVATTPNDILYKPIDIKKDTAASQFG